NFALYSSRLDRKTDPFFFTEAIQRRWFKVHQIGFTDLETVGHAREWLIGIHASVSAGYLFFSASQSAPSLIYVPALPAQSPRACSSCRSVARKSSGAEYRGLQSALDREGSNRPGCPPCGLPRPSWP